MGLKINGEDIADAAEFAHDGCHKIYLIRSDAERQTMLDYGYTDDGDILPVSELPAVWDVTCPLRFISSADLTEHYVLQGNDATVVFD